MKVFRQTDGYSCGPRSLQIAMSHYGCFPKYKELLKVCDTNTTGTDVDTLETAAEFFGFEADVYEESASVELIRKYTENSIPVLVMWYAGEDFHISVAYKVDKHFVYLLDPSLHLYTEPTILIKKNMLNRCWSNHPDSRWIMALYLKGDI